MIDHRNAWSVMALAVVGACHARAARGPALPLGRIAIVGASVSAGFGGAPFGEAFAQAAPGSAVESEANLMMFRDPLDETKSQLARAIAFRPTVIVALDFLFWDCYGSPDPAWRERALDAGLTELERARVGGAWIVVGDVPRITTAAEWMLPHELVPDAATLATLNGRITAWAAGRDRVLLVPLVEWTEPLRSGGSIELVPGERVDARSLLSADGLHANPLGTWYLLDRLDHWIEGRLPGTARDALVFQRPH
jgi:hypothetical protein